MGIFDMFKKKKEEAALGPFKLENFYDAPIDNPTWEQVQARIEKMMKVSDEHVLLSLDSAPHGVSYIQSIRVEGGFDVQIGVGKDDNVTLMSKICTEEELIARFTKYYKTAEVDDIDRFKPMAF